MPVSRPQLDLGIGVRHTARDACSRLGTIYRRKWLRRSIAVSRKFNLEPIDQSHQKSTYFRLGEMSTRAIRNAAPKRSV